MTTKIFKNILITCLCATVIIISLFLVVLYNNFKSETITKLKNDAVYLTAGYKVQGIDYLESIETSDRITLIDESGEVIYDNHANVEKLDDHSDRIEINEAFEDGEGYSERYSDTIGKVSLYYAKAIDNDTVLRISTQASTISALLLGMTSYLFWIIIIVAIIAVLIANRLAKAIVKPINDIDLNKPNIISPYKELSPLFARINEQNYTINKQIKNLNQRKEEFKTMTENMAEGIIVINQKKDVLTYNESAAKLFGAHDISENNSVFQFDHSLKFMEAIDNVVLGQKSEYKLEKDDKVYSLLINPILVNGKPSGATILIIDITAKELQDKLRREFSANVSHELKTPLTSISGFAEIMKNGLVDPEDVKDIAGNIYDEAKRLIVLIDDIIRLSRLDNSDVDVKKESVDLKALAIEVIAHLKNAAKQKHIAVSCEGYATVNGVSYLLEEVIQNLIDNAIKYGKDDGYAKVSLCEKDNEAIIKVEDNGIGIAASDLDRIFERFYRSDKSHSKAIGGTGLGLSIVKHAVEYHNGKIEVESKLIEGSSFVIRLPK